MVEARRRKPAKDAPLKGVRILIVESGYYEDIADTLLAGARRMLDAAKASYDVVTVPGALEIPVALQAMAESDDFDALIALGCIIRGQTYHFELVANESGAGVTRVALDHEVPIANAILTVENVDQAWARVQDKGRDAARVAVEMANLMEDLL